MLNRNTKTQVEGVTVIQADRHDLGNRLKSLHFDIVLDVTAYNANDISCLVETIGSFETYIMISSSSVYPDDGAQPFLENSQLGENKFWGQYGLDKIAAEKRLLELVPKQKGDIMVDLKKISQDIEKYVGGREIFQALLTVRLV